MFGIGGSEILFILLIVLMLFGSDKIPEMARTLGKLMAQLKNATNEIKSEIQKGSEDLGLDTTVKEITSEITKAKNNFISEGTSTVNQLKEDIESATGPIKRQF